jgi:hypothetical protein
MCNKIRVIPMSDKKNVEKPAKAPAPKPEKKPGFRAVSQKKGGAMSAADQAKKTLGNLDLDDEV